MIDESQMTLARDWDGRNIIGWDCSEKIEDCRLTWDGADTREFWTRGGNVVKAPDWFKRGFPAIKIDGGIWAGRGNFESASVAVRFGGKWFEQPGIEFVPFDLPEMIGPWKSRIGEANRAIKGCLASPLKHWPVRTYNDFVSYMIKIRPLKGEGVCFRNPEINFYEKGRSENLLRFKFEEFCQRRAA